MDQAIYSGVASVTIPDADVATNQDFVIVNCPAGARIRVKQVSVCFGVLPTAATLDIIERDSSANTEATLADDIDVVTSQTSAEGQDIPLTRDAILEEGDSLRALLTAVTAGSVEGLNITYVYQLEKVSR